MGYLHFVIDALPIKINNIVIRVNGTLEQVDHGNIFSIIIGSF